MPNLHPVYSMDSTSLAERHSIQALLNCYCREIAMPNHGLKLLPLHREDTLYAYLDDRASLIEKKYQLILILPDHQKILIAIHKPSLTYHFTYVSVPIITSSNETSSLSKSHYKLLYFSDLVLTITNALAKQHESSINLEFIQQAIQSYQVMECFLKQRPNNHHLNFIQSEQSLVFGHEFHPTPKARQGFEAEDIHIYSPELSNSFQLYYFKINKSQLRKYNQNHQLPPVIIEKEDHLLYPIHPWQAQYLLQQEEVKQVLINNHIQPIGPLGDYFSATSSVRTLFQENHPYFYKFSLNVRLTNCIRKNSETELKTAIELTHILNQHTQDLSKKHRSVTLLNESHAFSLKLDMIITNNPILNKKITEGFGFILRDNPLFQNTSDITSPSEPLLAVGLFSSQPHQNSWIETILLKLARHEKCPYEEVALKWFNRYINILIPAILDYYLCHGITFEPHLQNVLIKLDDEYPCHIYLRDLEGTKLNPKYSNISLNHLDQATRSSMTYNTDQSWQRIIYCLFINNISSSIHFISKNSEHLEKKLWQNVSLTLRKYQTKLSNQQALEFKQRLFNPTWPYKANLKTRFLKSADKKQNIFL
ncbi:IucA/IucC family protein [Piscirickettsia litoralis]|uniref:IucA/IucC family siderophore biosynthesis protein n=1 Tax=Piscirickettsia litoralis TaxID=1891921 RepID=A0ABX3A0Q9_9GAMM|nr:IucA/IucC family protein [Piscirickettsia litoralis]ODN42060.1 hypothetical protein BGC07_02690 [Piscirickettsia litoralis]